jgi:hypothetical protein
MDLPRPRTMPWLLVVFIASFALAFFLPVPELLKGVLALPGVAALVGMLVQLGRDQLRYEHDRRQLARQQDFALATASHMAEVAYDKHVAFCEAYIERTNRGLQELFAQGPSEAALGFASDLYTIRMQYRTWLTAEIEERLIPYEKVLREIGAHSGLLDYLETGEERTRVVEAMYEAFKLASGIEPAASEEDKARSSAHVVDSLRDVLGIRELTVLRQAATRLAIDRLRA